jgi:ribonucleoside-diphosphate reductase alpha chain
VFFLDKVIEKNIYPFPEIEKATRKTRKIGLGLMGVHDALLLMGLAYDSPEGRTWCESIMRYVTDTAVKESHILAEQLGPFPAWEESTWKDFPVRNATLTSIAPTGSLSLLAMCSSGIEPLFSFAYTRMDTVGTSFNIINPIFRAMLKKNLSERGFSEKEQKKLMDEAICHVHETGTIQDLKWLPEDFRAIFKTALDIHWKDHILMQAAFQRHVHASISKTINMPNTATKEDCAEALMMAWRLKLKGITIYRAGSRQREVLNLKEIVVDSVAKSRRDSCNTQ